MGANAEERFQPQPLICSVSIGCDTRRAGRSGRLQDTIDYTAGHELCAFVLNAGRFRLLETAAEALANAFWAAALRPGRVPGRIGVTLKKPLAFGGQGYAQLTIERGLEDFAAWSAQRRPDGGVRVFHSPELVLELLDLAPGDRCSLATGSMIPQSLWTLTSGLKVGEMEISLRKAITLAASLPGPSGPWVLSNPGAESVRWLLAGHERGSL